MLARKLSRDLLRRRWQVLPVVAVTLLGTALFSACTLAYLDLRDSYQTTQTHLHLADMTLDVTALSVGQVRQVAHLPGVAAAAGQLVLERPLQVPRGRDAAGQPARVQADGRLISLPLGRQALLDQVVVLSGRYPTASHEVLVERHFAAYQHLAPGATVAVAAPGRPLALRVVGIAVSAEYLWVARSRQDVMPSPAEFGVLFVPRPLLAQIGRASAAGAAGDNRLLYDLAPGADGQRVLAQVRAVLGPSSVLAATPRQDLVGVQLLQLDVDGLREMALVFPLFFLAVGGFIVAALLYRRVDQEAPLIGTMMALGLRRRAVVCHYVAYGLVIGLLGTALGSLAGVLAAGALTVDYARELAIPFVATHVEATVVLVGAALGLAAPLLAGVPPARRAARLAPAQAMRPFLPQGAPRLEQAAGLLRHAPVWLRLSVRDLARHPARALSTAAGVGVALILIVSTAGMGDALAHGLDLLYHQAQRYDMRADLGRPQPAAALGRTLGRLHGVRQVETLLSVPVQVQALASGRTYVTVAQGVPPTSRLLHALDGAGRPLVPYPGEAILTQGIAQQLHVGRGDRIRLHLLPAGPVATLRVGALSTALMGNAVTLSAADAGQAFHLAGLATAALVTVDRADRAALRAQLQKVGGGVQVTDQRVAQAQMDALTGLLTAFLGVMLLCGVVLAAAILFNTATLSVLERRRELATMRALGQRMRAVAWVVTVENGLIAVLGLLLGLPLALVCLAGFLRLSSSDLFNLPFWVAPRTVAVAVLGALLVLLLAQWPALRAVARMNLAEAAKARE